jgi:hypothetical protein
MLQEQLGKPPSRNYSENVAQFLHWLNQIKINEKSEKKFQEF